MKRLLYNIHVALVVVVLLNCWLACEQDLPLYNDKNAKLNFVYEDKKDSTITYSFIYNQGGERDTIWVPVRTMGFLAQDERHYEVEQVSTGQNDAVPGKHYLSFDDEAYQGLRVIRAGEVSDSLPIIVLRDASLATQDVQLKLRFKENANFKLGYPDLSFKVITISDQIVKPNRWGNAMTFIFGKYGTEKHRFMIAHSKVQWDDEYLKSQGVSNYYIGLEVQSVFRAMASKFTRELRKVNAARAEQGLAPLAESTGESVSFGTYN